jgi:hypothetical protein
VTSHRRALPVTSTKLRCARSYAAIGALATLWLFDLDLSIIATIGILMLIGIVKNNAIMMIDFALAAQRDEGMAPAEAIRKVCLLRYRPIMMTTLAAMMGAIPTATGWAPPRSCASRSGLPSWAVSSLTSDHAVHHARHLSLPRPPLGQGACDERRRVQGTAERVRGLTTERADFAYRLQNVRSNSTSCSICFGRSWMS